MDQEELNGMVLLQEQKRSKQEIKRLECENKLLIQTTERTLDGSVWKAGTSSRYVERLLEALHSQYARLAMNVMKTFGACCGKKVFELKHFSVENIQECTGELDDIADFYC